MNLPYTIGQQTKRAKIHEQFGGNPQCGISSSGQVDAVFLFTGDDGDNPYEDIWVLYRSLPGLDEEQALRKVVEVGERVARR